MRVTGEAVRIHKGESMADAVARAAAKYTNRLAKEATALALPMGTNASEFIDEGWLVSLHACQANCVLVGEPVFDSQSKELML